MSRITKWKLEKTKVKVVFRLQFHATHIPASGWEKLFISFTPTELGKAIAKTTKANVRNGTCKWGDPIYETTRLLQDTKTKQYDEKLYKLVVSMGSSRSSILGEATINLADYADALKPSAVAMPLHGCNSETILHVTVQLLTSKTGFREFEQQRELRERGLQMGTESGTKVSSSEATSTDRMDKVNTRVRFRPESKEFPSREEGLNEEYADSAVGFDGSSNASESLYAEKHDSSSTHEIDSLKSTVSGDLNGLSHCQSPQAEKGDLSDHQFLPQGWGSDYSIDNDLTVAYEENGRLRGSLEVAESSIYQLKLELSSLQSHADELGGATQKFACQLEAEIASSDELAKEILFMKSECLKFKDDLEQLKNHKLSYPCTNKESSEQDDLLHDKQVTLLNGLLIVDEKVRELQRKAYLGFDESNFSFLHSDLEALLSILQDVKHGKGADVKNVRDMNLLKNEQFASGTGFDVELYQPEHMLRYVSLPSLVSQESESRGATDAMEFKNFELLRELEEAKVERESLARKMDQMECYYESLVQELEESQKQMLGELQDRRNEHSVCLYTISAMKAETESIRQDMNEQILRFSEERRDRDLVNKELERRTLTSEAALKRAALNYSIAVDKLQNDLELLSFQVLSMFETNKNLMKQAFSETSQPCLQGYSDIVQNFESSDVAKLSRCLNQRSGIEKQLMGEDILSVDMKKSLHLQEELYQKVEEELCEMHSTNLYLDVLSKTFQETLVEAYSEIGLMKEKMDEITQHLDLTTESREVLMARLETAMNDNRTLNEYRAVSISKSSDMLLQNQISEAKLESVSMENCLLKEKIVECELLMKEYKSYQNKYVGCLAEKLELEKLLKLEAIENGNFQSEVSSLKEELKILDAGFQESAVTKENLQKTINFLQDKLGSLLASYEQLSGHSLVSTFHRQDSEFTDIKGIITQLEESQHNACKTILQLMDEKKDLQEERDVANKSLSTLRSVIQGMKLKFKHDIQDMEGKLDVSNTLAGKLQVELESVASKLRTSAEVEERYAQQNEELFADLARVEHQMQELTCKNWELGQEILGLGTISEELERSKMIIAGLAQEKQELQMLLETKTVESVERTFDIDSLKGSLRCLQDELHVEKGFREKLKGTEKELGNSKMRVTELTQEKQELTKLLEGKTEEARKLASDLDSLRVSLRCLQENLHVEMGFRNNLEGMEAELGSSKISITKLTQEKQEMSKLLEAKTEESLKLASDLDSLNENLRSLEDDLHVEKGFRDKLEGTIAELEGCKMMIIELRQEKQEITQLLEAKTVESLKLESDLGSLKESFRSLEEDLQVEKGFRDKLDSTVAELGSSKMTIAKLTQEKQDLNMLLEAKTNEIFKLESDLDSLKGSLRSLQDEFHVEKSFRDKLEGTVTELGHSKMTIAELMQEKQEITELLEAKTEESLNLASDLDNLKESLRCLQDELHVEKSFRDKLEGTVAELIREKRDLTVLLEGKTEESLKLACDLDSFKESSRSLEDDLHIEKGFRSKLEGTVAELGNSKMKIAELTQEKQDLTVLLEAKTEESFKLESDLDSLKDNLRCLQEDLHIDKGVRTKLEGIEKELGDSKITIAELMQEKQELTRLLVAKPGESCKDSLIAGLRRELSEMHQHLLAAEVKHAYVKTHYETLIEELQLQLELSDGDHIELQKKHLASAAHYRDENAELATTVQSLTSELEASFTQNRVLSKLNSEIAGQLEEYKWSLVTLEGRLLQDTNLREQLERMVENAEEEISDLILFKSELEIVVIVLKAQLDESYDESMKLRNQLNELNRKLSEQILRTEEFKNLSVHLKELKDKAEAESLLTREKKPEGPSGPMQESLRIAFIKEQYETKLQELKQQLSISKKHGEEMLWKLQDVVDEIENRKKSEALNLKRNDELAIKVSELEAELQLVLSDKREKVHAYDRIKTELDCTLLSLECCKEEKEKLEASLRELESKEILGKSSITIGEAEIPTSPMNVQSTQVLVSKGVHGIPEHDLLNQANSALRNSKNIGVNDNFQAQNLRSSMEHLHKELEKMKNENSHFPQATYDPYIQDLQRELMHLHKANEELGSIFPLFNGFLESGNALERVLALEIELAEALRAKKKSSFHIQSSFLKQHGDEEALFKSFRDINELIKDMLELKGRYAGVETELKEMHDRYSDLSLQFAEVEGERQKLMMTLKNIRTSKKPVHLNRSSSDTLYDNHPL